MSGDLMDEPALLIPGQTMSSANEFRGHAIPEESLTIWHRIGWRRLIYAGISLAAWNWALGLMFWSRWAEHAQRTMAAELGIVWCCCVMGWSAARAIGCKNVFVCAIATGIATGISGCFICLSQAIGDQLFHVTTIPVSYLPLIEVLGTVFAFTAIYGLVFWCILWTCKSSCLLIRSICIWLFPIRAIRLAQSRRKALSEHA